MFEFDTIIFKNIQPYQILCMDILSLFLGPGLFVDVFTHSFKDDACDEHLEDKFSIQEDEFLKLEVIEDRVLFKEF